MKRSRPRLIFAGKLGLLDIIAWVIWLALFAGVSLRVAHQPERNNLVPTYRTAGEHWICSQPLYQGERGFIYSPPVAAAMVPLALLPQLAADMLWRFLSLGAFLAALYRWKNSGLSPQSGWPLALVLLAPLILGNLNNGQANLLVIALLIAAVAAIRRDCWTTAAVCFVLPAYLKIYPAVVGLLFILLYPRQLGWRTLIAGVIIALLAFLFQRPSYVAAQYHLWVTARFQEDRSLWDAMNTPQDFRRLLMFTNMSKPAYHVIQAASALVVASLAIEGRRLRWSAERLLVPLFSLACAWMVLFGPATESSTYVLLAPALVFALISAFTNFVPNWMRFGIILILSCHFMALAIISFTPWRHSPIVLIQPFGALLFFVYGLVWAQLGSAWDMSSAPGARSL